MVSHIAQKLNGRDKHFKRYWAKISNKIGLYHKYKKIFFCCKLLIFKELEKYL